MVPLKLTVFGQTATSYGGATANLHCAGLFLAATFRDYGPAIRALRVTASARGGTVRHWSLQPAHDEFHTVALPALPKVRFFRKRAEMHVEYETQVIDGAFLQAFRPVELDPFLGLTEELARAFHLFDGKLKKSDDFDLTRFHADVSARLAQRPVTLEALRELYAQLEQAEQDRRRHA